MVSNANKRSKRTSSAALLWQTDIISLSTWITAVSLPWLVLYAERCDSIMLSIKSHLFMQVRNRPIIIYITDQIMPFINCFIIAVFIYSGNTPKDNKVLTVFSNDTYENIWQSLINHVALEDLFRSCHIYVISFSEWVSNTSRI